MQTHICITCVLFFILLVLLIGLQFSPFMTRNESWSSLYTPRHDIPHIILQVTKTRQPSYVVNMVKERFDSTWTYVNFTDVECVHYMTTHIVPGYERIVEKFRSLSGPHRADLFRYLYLYLNGGVFLDGDFMLYRDFRDFYRDEDFISIQTYHKEFNALFNGFIVVRPHSPIMFEAFDRLYHTSPLILRAQYLRVCMDLYAIVKKYTRTMKIKIYREVMDGDSAYTSDDHGRLLSRHYWRHKKIPILSHK